MELARLIEALSDAAAYPHPVEKVQIHHPHISVVFLAGPFAYKVKKPVNLGFLDFITLEKRLHFCEEEVRLNRRLAPHVYLGVVPVVETGKGLQVEAKGEVVEWAVKMQRLPDEATLLQRLGRTEVGVELVESLAQRIASFHRGAEANERIAAFGRFDAVTRIVLDIFAQVTAQVGTTVSAGVFGRVQALVQGVTHPASPPHRGTGRARCTARLPRRPAPGPRLLLPRPTATRRFSHHRLH